MGEANANLSMPRWQNILEWSILAIALLVSALIILQGSGIVPKPLMDQHFVGTVNLQLRREAGHLVFQYPNLMHSGGITSSLIAGIYKLIVPTTPNTLNWHFKIFAMASSLVSSFCLLRTVIPNQYSLRILGFLIIATSGFQLLEPSSDVISVALLNLFFIAVLRRWPRVITAFVLATFGLCKVELTLSATALACLWCLWEWRRGIHQPYLTIGFTAFFLALYLAPAFVLAGSNPFASDRSTTAFFSAYRDYMRLHQFVPITPTIEQAELAMRNTIFRDSPSFRDVVFKHPDLYFDFLGVSAARSLPNVLKVFKFMTIPFLLVLSQVRSIKHHRFLLLGAALVAACIYLPSWLVIFVRMRYMAKVLPLVVIATIACASELAPKRKMVLQLTWLCGFSSILWQVFALTPYQD